MTTQCEGTYCVLMGHPLVGEATFKMCFADEALDPKQTSDGDVTSLQRMSES